MKHCPKICYFGVIFNIWMHDYNLMFLIQGLLVYLFHVFSLLHILCYRMMIEIKEIIE